MTLTAPRLTLSNGQLSYTFVGSQQTFVSDLQPVVSNAAVAFDPQIGVVPDGVRLVVRGVISADRRYVTLDVTTDVASTTLTATQTSQAAAGGTGNIPGNGIATGTIQLPTVTITRVQTTVTVPDQGTLLMGGQRVVNEYITETGVPVLSKIPVLNRFFTNRIETKEEQTLLILIKPTVLIQSEEEEKAFPGLQDALGY
jgi:type II secretory pathway component GspD/PulD (secretin)